MEIENLLEFNNGTKIYIDGPLARAFSEDLHELYKKEIEPKTGMVLESQVMQMVQRANSYIEAAKVAKFKDNAVGMVYVVDSLEAIAKDLLNVSKAIVDMNNNQIRSSAVVIYNNENDSPIAKAIECYCDSCNIPVFYSLEEYVNKVL